MISNQSTTGFLLKDVLIARDSEADPDPLTGMRIESVGRHRKKAKSGSQSLPDFAYTNK
jgi:hypothetical protein